jgi:thiol:disulfide interchange protein
MKNFVKSKFGWSVALHFFLIAMFAGAAHAQILTPVKWSFEVKKVGNSEYDLVSTAKIDKDWNVYSQFIEGDGPIPTKLSFTPSAQYQLQGKAQEVSTHKKSGFDKVFEMNITKFNTEVSFVQRIKATGATEIRGKVEWQTCDEEKCLPPDEKDFIFRIPAEAGAVQPPPAQPNNPVQVVPNNPPRAAAPINPPAAQPNTPALNKPSNPVSWVFEQKKISEKEYDLIFKAKIESGWHLYSQTIKGIDGPIPTSFSFNKQNGLVLKGKTTEESPKRRSHKEPLFDNMTVVDFSESATFTQRVEVTDPNQAVTGLMEYMSCDDTQCTPPQEVKFSFNLSQGTAREVADTLGAVIAPSGAENLAGTGFFTQPSQFAFDKSLENSVCGEEATNKAPEKSSLPWIFLLGFGGGLFALLTPCVFPMIPLTVSYFVKSSKDRASGIRNALIYAASIIVIYLAMGIAITTAFGPDALNKAATDPIMNLIFGVLFLVFAVSFFGYFEITLPSSWTNSADRASNKGGLLGIFFMAFTLALVSFSCTGPIIGTLLVQTATSGSGISAGPIVGMTGFATALALPFGLFALFPAWLHSLPKSGSWMDDVKVTLGFIEVALAFKFLSNADLIWNLKWLPYEAFLAIWIVCGLGLLFYHAGILKFKKSAKPPKMNIGRGVVMAATLLGVFYLGLGFQYNPKSETFKTPEAASGILPPAGYSYVYPQKCPLNLNCFHDLNDGIAYAKQVNKPILLDFTGYNCANCRKMEENVWNKPGITEIIRDKYVLVSLYTDAKRTLKTPYTAYTSPFDGKVKDTEGEMWADLEATFFNKNSQPFYVLLDPNLKVLNAPVAYTPDLTSYQAFLQCGVERFAQANKSEKTLSQQ